jgi:hypothetical protein
LGQHFYGGVIPVAIHRLLENDVFDPDEIAIMVAAYDESARHCIWNRAVTLLQTSL